MKLGIAVEFSKADETGGYVRGFASVVEIDGQPVVDTEGDMIALSVLRKTAHRFISDTRSAKVMHEGSKIGEVVESVLIDDDFAEVMKVADGRRGWWIGMAIADAEVRKRVRSGELKGFSIHGRGRRIPLKAGAHE